MGDVSGMDLISDLPQSILENILTRLPIRDAIKTSILSSKWRYKWSTLTELVFDEESMDLPPDDRGQTEGSLVRFVTRALFLHQGPIHKFRLSVSCLPISCDIEQWLLFLSRTDVKELILELGEDDWFRVPSCVFNCKKLTRLELLRCELDPPASFKGFLCLKTLILNQVLVSADAIESLISSCPLLESLLLSYFDGLALTIRAPNLKYLYLEGEVIDICLESTPQLVSMSVSMYMNDELVNEQSSCCNFVKFLGDVPQLETLTGRIYFTKYLSIGDDSRIFPVTYNHLKVIELSQVNFEDVKEILVVLRLITSSPNLKELRISGSANSPAAEAADSDLLVKEYASDYKFSQLKVVKMTDVSGIQNEMEFIKFLLRVSPTLRTMSIIPYTYVKDGRLKMLIELLRFQRASPEAEIIFVPE